MQRPSPPSVIAAVRHPAEPRSCNPRAAILLLAPALLCASAAAHAGTLTIDVDNVRNSAGMIHIDVCPEAKFLKDDCRLAASAPARAGTTVLTVRDVPDGVYAVQAFHDENGNGKVDRALFGIPKEGIAFSNDAPIHFGPPSWNDARMTISGSKTIRIKMRYMMGAHGPAGT
jgi:uncharacterized protein (DUF2141 family)